VTKNVRISEEFDEDFGVLRSKSWRNGADETGGEDAPGNIQRIRPDCRRFTAGVLKYNHSESELAWKIVARQ